MSNTSSAQLKVETEAGQDQPSTTPLPPFQLTEPETARTALKREAAERIAAHRSRRGQAPAPAEDPPPLSASRVARTRSAHIAATVAERYAHSQSYRAFLAAEAERSVRQAEAAAQIATINAQAIAVAQQRLLSDLESWESVPPSGPVAVPNVPLSPDDFAALFDRQPVAPEQHAAVAPAPVPCTNPSLTVLPFDDIAHSISTPRALAALEARMRATQRTEHPGLHPDEEEDERYALDEEIAFRHNPVFEEIFEPEPIAVNLIEFPRQLVAPRKARPRIAEGPLRGEDGTSESGSQLRIFEVEADHLASAPGSEASAPEWSSILLSARPSADFPESLDADYLPSHAPQAATIRRRLLAASIDGALVLTVEAAFAAVFALALTHLAHVSPAEMASEVPHSIAVVAAAGTLAVLVLLYQLLFFTLSDTTPGMRCARIGLCTFSDENPTRAAMRKRILHTLLAAVPLGLGLLWAFLDEDTLGWHDRLSRMYQRSY